MASKGINSKPLATRSQNAHPIITVDLLRRRAEHNNCELSTLTEITLHQFDIERIELIQECCPCLRVLFLQNNQISRIENMSRLKALQYLNLAVNNIRVIENLDGLESLAKLDLTLNFIDNLTDVGRLSGNIHLTHLFLTGNPLTKVPEYRAYVTSVLPQLRELDGTVVVKSERIIARQDKATVRVSEHAAAGTLAGRILEDGPEAKQDDAARKALALLHLKDPESLAKEFQDAPTLHTPATRLLSARQLARMRGEDDAAAGVENPANLKDSALEIERHAVGGIPIQRNDSRLSFNLETSAPHLRTLCLHVPRSLATDAIDVIVRADAIRVRMRVPAGGVMALERTKKKNTPRYRNFQLRFDGASERVDPERACSERSAATGVLLVHMVLESHNDTASTAIDLLNAEWARQAKSAKKTPGNLNNKNFKVTSGEEIPYVNRITSEYGFEKEIAECAENDGTAEKMYPRREQAILEAKQRLEKGAELLEVCDIPPLV